MKKLLRTLLPWLVSAAALGYVFGWATDWQALRDGARGANLPLFVLLVTIDKLIFFLGWGFFQALALRRFVAPIRTRQVIEVRGGAELLRALSNPLADGAFLFGLTQLLGGRAVAVAVAFGIPAFCHTCVLLTQATLALFFAGGGPGANRDIALTVIIGWALVLAIVISVRFGLGRGLLSPETAGPWLAKLNFRTMVPFFGLFAVFAAVDVLVQGLASRAFGVPIGWWALAGRIPLLYLVLSLPSFANYGTRELAWAGLFEDFAPRETLFAFALATNTVFFVLHVLIGAIFLPRALALIGAMRRARREGVSVPAPPLLRDASDP